MTSSLGQAAGAAILAAHAASTAPSPVPTHFVPVPVSTPSPAPPPPPNADRVAAARARLADIERVVAGPPRLKRVRRLSAALLDDLRAAVDAAEHNAALAGAEWGHDLVSVADQVLADLGAVRHMSVLGYLLHGRNARRVLRAHAAWLATLHAEATRVGGPRVVPAGAPRAMVVDLGSVSASPRSLTMESIHVAPGQPLVTPLAVAAEEHLVVDPMASPAPPLPPAQLSRLLSDSRGAPTRNGGVSSEVAEALAKVIALANDPRFLLQLRKDSTCNFQDLLDIVEVLALACPSQAPKRLPLLTMSIESHYPPEPCHDRLSGEALQARIDQIVRSESPPMTVRRSSLVSFASHGGRRESLTDRGQAGVFASVQSLTPLLETMATNDVHNPAQPSLSRITTVAAIMEQQFNPAARVGTGTLNSVRRGSAVSGAAAAVPNTPTAAEKMAEAAPGLTMGHVWLHESARPIATIERRYPSSNRNSAILFPPPVFTRSMQNEPVQQADSLPRSHAQMNGNSLSRQSHKSHQSPPTPGSPAGATADLSTATGPAPAGNVPPTPLSPQPVESDSHFDTCPVCKLVQDYSYAKYIQLAVLFHENNDLGMSYHCLVHAIQVSEERGACVPTPYFLAGLYLRHGWGCRPDLAKSFDCLMLALEYALRQAQHAVGSTMARTTMRSAGSDPTPPPEEIAPATSSAAAVAPPPILARPYSTMARPLSAASRTLSDVPAAAPRTKLTAYIATFRDSPLPIRDDDIEASSQRLGVALILYEVSVSLRFGWGVRGDSRLAKALAKLAANLGDPQAALEVGMRLAASSGVRLSLSSGASGAGSVESLPGRITRQLSRVLSRSKSMSAVGKSSAAGAAGRGSHEPAMLRNSWSSSLADIPEREVAPANGGGAGGVRRQGSRVARRKREAVAYLRYVARSGVQDPAITWALAPKWD
ncbi:hypothetical protein GGF32_000164 [Allomyces javanicus]|nr:hypothetical protein GGF32_000164 [Allomyces javanicus]